MSDVVIPARVRITRELDPYGLPITRATLDVDDVTAELPLPGGRKGEQGPRGRPRAPWVKAGEVDSVGDLPVGLGPDDRGKWWHDLATDDMWTWTGTGWKQSAGAVGPSGPVAVGSVVDEVQTIADPKLRVAAAEIVSVAGSHRMKLTVPAGHKGQRGPVGASGSIVTSDDYDATHGPVEGSLFAWSRRTRKFRPTPPAVPIGLWAAGPDAFPATTALENVDTITLVQIDIPALPFSWRPRVYGRVATYADNSGPSGFPHVWARLNDPAGPPVAMGLNGFRTLQHEVVLTPYFSEQGGAAIANNHGQASRLTPSSTIGVVAAYEPASIYVRVERDKGSASSGSNIRFVKTAPYVQVQAIPVAL